MDCTSSKSQRHFRVNSQPSTIPWKNCSDRLEGISFTLLALNSAEVRTVAPVYYEALLLHCPTNCYGIKPSSHWSWMFSIVVWADFKLSFGSEWPLGTPQIMRKNEKCTIRRSCPNFCHERSITIIKGKYNSLSMINQSYRLSWPKDDDISFLFASIYF